VAKSRGGMGIRDLSVFNQAGQAMLAALDIAGQFEAQIKIPS
jgi:hypothetical protein